MKDVSNQRSTKCETRNKNKSAAIPILIKFYIVKVEVLMSLRSLDPLKTGTQDSKVGHSLYFTWKKFIRLSSNRTFLIFMKFYNIIAD